MKTNISSSKTQSRLLSVALAAAVLSLNAHASPLASISTVREAQENAAAVLAGQENVAAQFNQATMLASNQNLSIVYVGSERFKSQFTNGGVTKAELDPQGSRQIVIVERGDQDRDVIMRLLANGNFVITVGNAPVDAAQSAFQSLRDIIDGSKLSKTWAEYDADQIESHVDSNGGDEPSITAYFYSPKGGTQTFETAGEPTTAVSEALRWAKDLALSESHLTLSKGWTVPDHTRSYSVSCGASSGKLNIKTTFSKLSSDGSTSYDYWQVKYATESVPASGYQTYSVTTRADLDELVTAYKLADHDPQTTSGSSTATVGLGLSIGGPSVDGSYSYTISDISVVNNSDSSFELAKWTHTFKKNAAISKSTSTISPGAVVRVANGSTSPWNNLKEKYDQTMVKYTFFSTAFAYCTKTIN